MSGGGWREQYNNHPHAQQQQQPQAMSGGGWREQYNNRPLPSPKKRPRQSLAPLHGHADPYNAAPHNTRRAPEVDHRSFAPPETYRAPPPHVPKLNLGKLKLNTDDRR